MPLYADCMCLCKLYPTRVNYLNFIGSTALFHSTSHFHCSPLVLPVTSGFLVTWKDGQSIDNILQYIINYLWAKRHQDSLQHERMGKGNIRIPCNMKGMGKPSQKIKATKQKSFLCVSFNLCSNHWWYKRWFWAGQIILVIFMLRLTINLTWSFFNQYHFVVKSIS